MFYIVINCFVADVTTVGEEEYCGELARYFATKLIFLINGFNLYYISILLKSPSFSNYVFYYFQIRNLFNDHSYFLFLHNLFLTFVFLITFLIRSIMSLMNEIYL